MYEFRFPETRVSFMKQAVVEFGMRNSKVEDINQFQRIATANVLNQFSWQVQDCGRSGFGGRASGSDDIVVVWFVLSF